MVPSVQTVALILDKDAWAVHAAPSCVIPPPPPIIPPTCPWFNLPLVSPQTIALTFDDGPDLQGATSAVLDVLASEGVTATFFINTKRPSVDIRSSQEAQQLIRRIVGEGHTLGSHTASHARGAPPDQGLAAFDDQRIQQELEEAEEVARDVLGPSAKPLTVSM